LKEFSGGTYNKAIYSIIKRDVHAGKEQTRNVKRRRNRVEISVCHPIRNVNKSGR
jgi:hypothetical protein